MKRRQFFKVMGVGLVGVVASLFPTQGAEPVILGVDVAAPVPDTSELVVQTPEDLGGFLLPPEYQDELLRQFARQETHVVMQPESARSEFFPDVQADFVSWDSDDGFTLNFSREQEEKGMHYGSTVSGEGMHYDHHSERPGITATWQET